MLPVAQNLTRTWGGGGTCRAAGGSGLLDLTHASVVYHTPPANPIYAPRIMNEYSDHHHIVITSEGVG